MPIYKGTNNIVAIYKGTNLIGSVYKGTTLVYSSAKAYHSNFTNSIVTLADSSGNYQYSTASGTAVAGTQYYSWNPSTRLYQTVSIAEGASVSGYYTLNASFVSANTVGVHIYSVGTFSNTTQMIIGQMQYGNNWYDIYDIESNRFDFTNTSTSNVTELIIYNVYKYKSEHASNISSGVCAELRFNGTSGLNNCAKITIINSGVYFYTTTSDGNRNPTIGLNVSTGVELVFDGCTYIPDYFSGNRPTPYAGSTAYTGIGKYKSVTFKGNTLKFIGDMAFHSFTNTAQYLNSELPQSLIYLGTYNDAIAYSGDTGNDMVYNIQNSNLKWRTVISGTIPSDTYGLASPRGGWNQSGTMVYDSVSLSSYDLPSSLQAVSKGTLVSSAAKTFGIHNNIFTPPVSNATNSNSFIGAYSHTFDFASNVTSIPAVVFENMSGISRIYIRCPNGTPVDIAYHAFYYKSSRSVSIYTDNQSVKDYNWSSNQNISPTFYHLDGTAWS